MKRNLRNIIISVLIVFIWSGSELQAQNDSTLYSAPGGLFRKSLIKMVQGQQFKIERDSLISLTELFQERIKESNEASEIKDERIITLEQLVKNEKEQNKAKDQRMKDIKAENKKKVRKTVLITAPIAFCLGLIASIFI